jgi:hypothetical protein
METMDFNVEFDRIADTVDLSAPELEHGFDDLDKQEELKSVNRRQLKAMIGSVIFAMSPWLTTPILQTYIDNFHIR